MAGKEDVFFPSMGFIIVSSGIIVLVFLYLHQLFSKIAGDGLSGNFDFWFICSQLIYQLGSFFIFLTYNYLTQKILPNESYTYENRSLLASLWGVHNVLLFLGSLITCFGVAWIYRKKSRLL